MNEILYEFEGPAADVRSRWQAVKRADESAERRSTRLLLGAGILVLALMAAARLLPDLRPPLAHLLWAFPVGIVACLVQERRIRAGALDMGKMLVASLLVESTEEEEDLVPEGLLRLKVDFRDYPRPEFQVPVHPASTKPAPAATPKTLAETLDAPIGGVWTDPERLAYRQTWLEFEGHFEGGEAFRLEVVRRVERKVHSRTTGRIGMRFEDEVHDEMALVLQAPAGGVDRLADRLDFEPPTGLVAQDPEVHGDAIRLRVLTPSVKRTDGARLGVRELARADCLVAMLYAAREALEPTDEEEAGEGA